MNDKIMKVFFTPKFHKGEIRTIYYQRLLKKAARVVADESLVRRIESLLYFDQCEGLIGAREIDGDVAALPADISAKAHSDVERLFVALCYDPSMDIDWGLYFDEPEPLVASLAEELELCE